VPFLKTDFESGGAGEALGAAQAKRFVVVNQLDGCENFHFDPPPST
jgi:hypothetical protein